MSLIDVTLVICCVCLIGKLHILLTKDTHLLGECYSDAVKLLTPSMFLLFLWAVGLDDSAGVDAVHKADVAVQGLFVSKVVMHFIRIGLFRSLFSGVSRVLSAVPLVYF